MASIVGVFLNNSNDLVYFTTGKYNLRVNITVVVRTDRGFEFGVVRKAPFVSDDSMYKDVSGIVRIATRDDYNRYKKNLHDARIALGKCRELIDDMGLNMTVVDCKYTLDRNQLIFRFLADSRVDFRNLARELASIYKTRIELRQMGARDKAREIGGCGQCGRSLCCGCFLRDLDAVSIGMAKNQGISLNPNKINGVCGRLMCCLKYEDDCYTKCKKRLPSVGSFVKTDEGSGKVISVDVLACKYKVDVPNVGLVEVYCGSD